MELTKDACFLQDFDKATKAEWLETNGLGGYASSTINDCNTRRYHGLLVAAVVPPTERMVLVSKLDETIVTSADRFELGCNDYGDAISPKGYQYLVDFRRGLFPEFIYDTGTILFKKTIGMVHHENTTFLQYEILKAENPFTLELTPLIAGRSYHELIKENSLLNRNYVFEDYTLSLMPYEHIPEVHIRLAGASFNEAAYWYNHLNYAEDRERGHDYQEDLFSPGILFIQLQEGDKITVLLTTENPTGKNIDTLFKNELQRRKDRFKKNKKKEVLNQLHFAADQFIVQRDASLKTVIAGYHWFTDWSRDTMISLPGLCLTRNLLDDAKKMLLAFAKNVSQGMLPNRFLDGGQPPEYNNVDGTLWYFIAIQKYLEAGGSEKFVLRQILPVLKEIMEWHYKGTRYDIHVAEDHLLFAGEAGVQLTWMDARVNDWVVTPRTGKAVEINALWYNAHRIFARLLKLNGDIQEAKSFKLKARQIRQQFLSVFWNEELGYLNDVIHEEEKDSSLRPNQLFALGLCFPLIKGKQARSVLQIVQEKLLTPYGLRSLAPDDANYKGTYAGNIEQRDGAYHQGTVWSWLIGPYIDALFNNYDKKSASIVAQQAINPLVIHLNDAGIGSISEIFDGDAPHAPRGCIAQAWSVGELIRVISQYKLFHFDQVVSKTGAAKGKTIG
jgi:predicted glycogen debranching enzyme